MKNPKGSMGARWAEADKHLESVVPQCHGCIHYQEGTLVCSAFPERIPGVILINEHDHSNPYPGDNGIRFERKK